MNTSLGLFVLQQRIRHWNSLVPASAVRVERTATGIRYLHPTKGWRAVSNRRLGIA